MNTLRERMAERRHEVEQDVIHVIEIVVFLAIVVIILIVAFLAG